MLYAFLCYHDEAVVNSWSKDEDDAVLAKRARVTDKLAANGKLGPAVRLMPTTAATTVRMGRDPLVIDGPFAEIDAALRSARPQALGALLRYFRDLDRAEEAFQEACLRALKSWPVNGPPRDPAAWLILVGRNFALDEARRARRTEALPADDVISDTEDAEADLAERLDSSHYRDDVLRLLFICCHPDLPATQQIALALRIVSGLTVKEIARG